MLSDAPDSGTLVPQLRDLYARLAKLEQFEQLMRELFIDDKFTELPQYINSQHVLTEREIFTRLNIQSQTVQPATNEDVVEAIHAEAEKTRQTVKTSAKELKGEIYKATQGIDVGCHHRDKSKDAYVQEVIQYLARPGVTFSINNACCKIAGCSRPGHCKKTWLYQWCTRNKQAILNAIDIIRGIQ